MLGEFVYRTRVYCIKSTLDPVTPDEKNLNFNSLKEARQFFAYAASDPFVREELYEIAQWMRPTSCRPPKNCPQLTNQELVELLCKSVYESGLNGNLRLVELVPPEPKPEFLFEECCVDSLRQISVAINNSEVSSVFLCIAQVNAIFQSHTRVPNLISMLSSAFQASGKTRFAVNWPAFIKATESFPNVTRISIKKVAEYETYKHIKSNNIGLRKYWERIYDATK